MTVLSTISHAPISLQPRAATRHGLNGGAIAGIVCIIGVPLLLAIFWKYLLGNHIFTRAKNPSASVVDKAEKGHVRAKDLYTTGREWGHQVPGLQDAAHCDYSRSDLEAAGYSSRVSSFQIIEQERPAYLARSKDFILPSYTPCPPSGSPSNCNASRDPSSLGHTSAQDVKPIVVDAKRMLGIDDASYLDEITTHDRKCSDDLIKPGMSG